MFSGFFGWIRKSTEAAILGGVQDAMTKLQLVQPEEIETPILVLTHRPQEADDSEAGATARPRKAK